MPLWNPEISCVVTPISNVYFWQSSPPICWPKLAPQFQAESGTQIDGGLLNKERGQIEGAIYPKRQDTYLSGSVGRTGRAFNVISGAWYDNLYSRFASAYGLSQPNGGAVSGSPNEVVSATTTAGGIEDAEIHVRLGDTPNEVTYSAPVSHNAQNTFCYLHLAYKSPDGIDYRIALEYGNPIALDVTYNANATTPVWQRVAQCRDIAVLERYVAQVGNELRFHVKTSTDGKLLTVEVGNGNIMSHGPDTKQLLPPKTADPDTGVVPPPLPSAGNIRVYQQGGTLGVWYQPARYNTPTVTTGLRDFGRNLDNLENGIIVTNALTPNNPDQTTTADVTGDGQNVGMSITAELPDAGDGFGSADVPVISDATLIIPAIWDTTIPGTPDGYLDVFADLRVMRIDLVEELNPVTCTGTMRGTVWVNNFDNGYSGAYGMVAVQVTIENGNGDPVTGQSFVVLTGVAGHGADGVEFFDANPTRYFKMNVGDKSEIMSRSILDTEWWADGWAWPSTVYFLAERGQVHPDFVDPSVPLYITDNGTPYGPAGEDSPWYSWLRGTGNNPAMRYTNEANVWDILSDQVVSLFDIDPYTGLPAPFFHFFDSEGIYHFGPLFLFEQPVMASYSDQDPTGLWRIMRFQAFNSVEDMRTELNWEGLDTNTYELLFSHLEQSVDVEVAVGFRRSWTERSISYASEDYLTYSQNVASIQASLPQQIFLMEVMAQPGIHCGMNITIQHDALVSQGYIVGANIQRIVSSYGRASVEGGGSAETVCRQLILARNILNVI